MKKTVTDLDELEHLAERLFGYGRGTKANRAAAMYLRPDGATNEEVVQAVGGPQRVLLKTVADKGAYVEKIKVPNDRGRPFLRYRIHTDAVPPPGPAEPPGAAAEESGESRNTEIQRRTDMLEERFGPKLLTWTEGFVAHWLEKNSRWAGTAFIDALPAMLTGIGISPLPAEMTDVALYDERALKAFPIYSRLKELVAYGFFGIHRGYDFFETFGDQFPDDEGTAASPNNEFPWRWVQPTEEIVLAAHAAAARYLVDESVGHKPGEMSVASYQIAALAQVSTKYIRNLMSPSSNSPLRTDKGDRVSAARVREWLNQRPDYLPTMTLDGTPMLLAASNVGEPLGQADFVPEAADGTRFLPTSRTHDGFALALPSGVETFADYADALRSLQTATNPSWFEPAKDGKMRRVFGAAWVRVAAAGGH